MIRKEHFLQLLLGLHRILFYYIKEFYHLSVKTLTMILQYLRDFWHGSINAAVIEDLDLYILDLEFDLAVMANNLRILQAPTPTFFLPYAEVISY